MFSSTRRSDSESGFRPDRLTGIFKSIVTISKHPRSWAILGISESILWIAVARLAADTSVGEPLDVVMSLVRSSDDDHQLLITKLMSLQISFLTLLHQLSRGIEPRELISITKAKLSPCQPHRMFEATPRLTVTLWGSPTPHSLSIFSTLISIVLVRLACKEMRLTVSSASLPGGGIAPPMGTAT
ncbi:hypothetical protein J1614_007187 [Plenodomus biglobosus]|nr:hypothetical protein J1614_007187 [Plenodomus biglobosus]